jgi:hypothetical protein
MSPPSTLTILERYLTRGAGLARCFWLCSFDVHSFCSTTCTLRAFLFRPHGSAVARDVRDELSDPGGQRFGCKLPARGAGHGPARTRFTAALRRTALSTVTPPSRLHKSAIALHMASASTQSPRDSSATMANPIITAGSALHGQDHKRRLSARRGSLCASDPYGQHDELNHHHGRATSRYVCAFLLLLYFLFSIFQPAHYRSHAGPECAEQRRAIQCGRQRWLRAIVSALVT